MVNLFGGANADYWETIRSTLLPLIGKQLAKYNNHTGGNHYVSYSTGRNEYICVVNKGEEELEEDLEAMGFERNPVAAWKTIAGTDIAEQGSWYMVQSPSDIPEDVLLTQNALGYNRGDNVPTYQLHLILYEIDGDEGTTVVFGHHELWWGAYPLSHYRGRYYSTDVGEELFLNIAGDYYGDEKNDIIELTDIDDLITKYETQ